MGFLQPALLLLAVPVLLAWWRWKGAHPVTAAIRLAFAMLLLAALGGAYLHLGSHGRDLVLVVDRSHSMPLEATSSALELTNLIDDERREGDRVFVVSFGAGAKLEYSAQEAERFAGFDATIDRDGSNIDRALETALEVLDSDRAASILLLSDGLNTGSNPMNTARRAYGLGVPVHVRHMTRAGAPDLLVERIELPGDVAVGEPFQFQVWVYADQSVRTSFSLTRDGRTLSTGERDFDAGRTRLIFRDRLDDPGIAEYSVDLGASDRVLENNRAKAAVRARGSQAILILNQDGSEDTLARVLRRAGMSVTIRTPEAAQLNPVGLSRFRALVLENVEARRLGGHMRSIATWVRDHGGGLLMTGGHGSFGIGGYYLSPVEDVLPVSMELRQEHRKLSMAMAVALDRSGSMSAPVNSEMTKMDLANLGTWSALELLSPLDHAAVVAVDSSPHVVVPMRSAKDLHTQRSQVLGIESMGGGIFVFEALQELEEQLRRAPQTTQHMILFSDASDSESQAGSFDIVKRMRARPKITTTLSVVALGSETDPDAQFLVDLATLGGGEAYFSDDPTALPRIFAQDTLTVSRSTFVEEATNVTVRPDLIGLGTVPVESFPVLSGYNLTYPRAQSSAGLVTDDEFRAPVLAFAYQGLGRTAAFTAQVGGSNGSEVSSWNGLPALMTTLVRWLAGTEEPNDVFVDTRREGRDAHIEVEFDTEARLPVSTAQLSANLTGPDGSTQRISLLRTGPSHFAASVPLAKQGALVGTVELGDGRALPLPPLTLPYSPEFERTDDRRRGRRLMTRIAEETGGKMGASVSEALAGNRDSRAWRPISRELCLGALLLFLLEIAGRRLGIWQNLGRRWAQTRSQLSSSKPRANGRRGPSSPPTKVDQMPQQGETVSGLGSALDSARKVADRKLDR